MRLRPSPVSFAEALIQVKDSSWADASETPKMILGGQVRPEHSAEETVPRTVANHHGSLRPSLENKNSR